MRAHEWLSMLLLSATVVACSPGQPTGSANTATADVPTVRASIEAANTKFIDAFKRADGPAMMANYADDAIIMMPSEELWRGREGMRKGFDAFLSQMTLKEGATKTEDVMVGGDLAVETGTFAWTLQPKTGSEIKDRGKYLTVWKRQPDGAWKIVRDINNSDLPAAR